MKELFKEIFDDTFEFLFPSNITCFICGDEVVESEFCLCPKCEKNLPKVGKHCLKCGSPIRSDSNFCLTCKSSKRYFDFARSPLIYKDGIAHAIQGLKYENRKHLAAPLAKIMETEFFKMKEKIGNFDLIVPIPLSKERFKKRGYNQAELLALELSKLVDVPVESNCVSRVKDTVSQTKLSFKERQENLEGAFKIESKEKVKGKTILLIDDVLTTGSTISHCAEILKKAGAKVVCALTFATTDSDRT